MHRLFLLALTLMLTGCASGMSKSECLYADWRAVGYEDGARGAPATAIAPRRAACAKKAALAPDMTDYLAGREQGLNEFCRPAKGFDLGAHGGRYDGVCAGRDEAAFTGAFAKGQELYKRQNAATYASNALSAAENDLNHIDHRIAEDEGALVSPETPNEQRVDILADLKHMNDERARIKRTLPGLHRDLDRAEAELAAYQEDLAADKGVIAPRPVSY